MRRILTFVTLILMVMAIPVNAGISVHLGYGSGLMVESSTAEAEREKLSLLSLSGDWLFPETRWGLGVDLAASGTDFTFGSGLQRLKVGLIFDWDNVRFFAGPTWTIYRSGQGPKTELEGIEFGGSARVDFTDNLHLEGLFSFAPLLQGVSITLPDPTFDTLFSGNISEYYFGLSYDLGKRVSATIGLGGWRVLEPVLQDRLVTVDYRRLGLKYTF